MDEWLFAFAKLRFCSEEELRKFIASYEKIAKESATFKSHMQFNNGDNPYDSHAAPKTALGM